MKYPRVLASGLVAAGMMAGQIISFAPVSLAQSLKEFTAHQEWCASIGGTHNNNPNSPVCSPGKSKAGQSSSGGGFSSRQQAALGLAGAFGSALGNALRESAEANARQAEMNRMQRLWEIEQEKMRLEEQRAIEQEERERRHRELLAKLKGSLGGSPLEMKRLDGETLQLKSGTALFGQPSNPTGMLQQEVPASAAIPTLSEPATVQGRPVNPTLVYNTEKAWDEYLVAVRRRNETETRLKQIEAEHALTEQLRREAATKLQEQRARTAAIPLNRADERKLEDDKLAEAERLLQEAIKLDEEATKDLAAARKDAEGAAAALAEAEKKKQQALKVEKE